jgi:hypothetical protein
MDNLWPEDIGQTDDETTPLTILQEQAKLLGTRTQNIITAIVETEIGDGYKAAFTHDFYIVAPILQNYRYRLFSVTHDIDFYPLSVYLEEGTAESDSMFGKHPLKRDLFPTKPFVLVESEDGFIDVLKLIFASKKARRAVKNLMAQSKPARGYTSPEPADDIPF